MAILRFIAYDINGEEHPFDSIESYELSMDYDAACHGVRLNYASDSSLPELVRLYAFRGEQKIFSGFIDTQREGFDDGAVQGFIYARSSACILVDNEAKPSVYRNPTARSLCVVNADDYGFTNDLGNISCDGLYQVNKGVSCFSAINDFVCGITGKRIGVDADSCIRLIDSDRAISIASDSILSERREINRGGVLRRIDYKVNSVDGYDHHIASRALEHKEFVSSKKQNMSSLPDWQRDYTLLHTLKSSVENYYCYRLEVDGVADVQLGDSLVYDSRLFGIVDGLVVKSIKHLMDSNGEKTVLSLVKDFDLEEITYVD